MHELMILIAKEMPEEILIDKMEEAFNQYRGGGKPMRRKRASLSTRICSPCD